MWIHVKKREMMKKCNLRCINFNEGKWNSKTRKRNGERDGIDT